MYLQFYTLKIGAHYYYENCLNILFLWLNLMNSFKLFEFKRTLEVFRYVESFFELHSSTTERKKDKNRAKNSNFLANSKSLNEFIKCLQRLSIVIPFIT